ncbi:hypothetical protein N9891_00875, partial [bacterium]|nr:hypothetical protein [bacterium]
MAPPPPKKLSVQKRCRSVPFPRPYYRAIFISSIYLLSLICFVTTAVVFVNKQDLKSAYLTITSLAVTCVLWTISIFARRAARCPLCQGTPYFDSGARKHIKATKLPIISHGLSNILSTIFVQTFHCMYCGQHYDLLKPVSNPPPGSKKR